MIICGLEKDINNCPFYKDDICVSKNQCSFQKLKKRKEYIRKERWYEKYYKN